MSGEFATYLMRSLVSEGTRHETVGEDLRRRSSRASGRAKRPDRPDSHDYRRKTHLENETDCSLTVTDTQDRDQAILRALPRGGRSRT